jgi:hypothetical protein
MQDDNIIFARLILSSIVGDVKEAGYKINKDAWVWKVGKYQYEFHGPDGYYNGLITATNAYEARYEGWMTFLSKEAA